MHIVGVMLAAGSGARFGGDKLCAPLPRASHGVPEGVAIGVASARHLAASVDEVVAVVRAEDTVLERALAQAGARTVVCARAAEGMGASLACGVFAASEADGWIVALGDMPWIAPATIAAVANALRGGAAIVVPTLRAQRGHPVGFAAQFGPPLRALRGDEGARSILRAHADLVRAVEVDDPGVLGDVDRKEDLARPA